MSSSRLPPLALVFCLLGLLLVCRPDRHDIDAASINHTRIISFAPSITETLFALGLEDRLVGVTRFCLYPPQAHTIPNVGGYVDPNFEMILGLKPDLVLMLREHGPLQEFLRKKSVTYRVIPNETLEEILSSFPVIAGLCGEQGRGDSLASLIRSELAENDSVAGERSRVLFCVGRNSPGGGQITRLFAAGPRTFYNDLIEATGGVNVCQDSLFAYPELSTEAVIRMAPEVVFDLMPVVSTIAHDKVIDDWKSLPMVPAVRQEKLFGLTGDYATIPGPRVLLLLRDMRRIMTGAMSEKDTMNK